MSKITISPVTRLSGFLKIDVVIENGVVIDAASSGTLFRGYESMLAGKDPRDAVYFTQRICGICSTAHSIAASKAIEAISNVKISKQAEIIRNIIHGFDFLQNHIRQTYFFVMPDFVKIPQSDSIPINDYRLPDSLTEKIGNDYVKAIDISRLAHQGVSVFGGKAPHNHGIVFGGVSSTIDPVYIGRALENLDKITAFVENTMQEDISIIEKYYSDYFKIGITPYNFLSFGLYDEFPEAIISLPKYIIGDQTGIPAYSDITESDSSIYPFSSANYQYNFVRAPRYLRQPMESGPLARAIVRGENLIPSTLNRIKTRANEALLICRALKHFIGLLEYGRNNPSGEIRDGVGTGYTDTIRGALLHHTVINNGRISSYNIITPSTWNLSPQDDNKLRGPAESSLIGTSVKDVNNPIEIIRTIHSFDPCLSCATHVYNKGNMLNEYSIVPW